MQENWIGKSTGLQFRFDADQRRGHRGLYHAPGYDLRRQLRRGRARSPAGAGSCVHQLRRREVHRAVQARRDDCRRAGDRREARLRHRHRGGASVRSRQAAAGLHRQLRADGLRHRRDHGRAGARPARLRFRHQVRLADRPRGRRLGGRGRRAADRSRGRRRDPRQLGLHRRDERRPGQRRRRGPRRGRGLGPGQDRAAPARLGRQPPALLGHADPVHPLRSAAAWCRCRRSSSRSCCPRTSTSPPPATRCYATRRGSTSIVRSAAARRRARPTRSTRSSTARGTSCASPASRPTSRSTRPKSPSGCRSSNISAASSTRSCTCSTPASGLAR